MTETSWLSAAVLGEVVAPPAEHHRRRWGLDPAWHGSLVFARCEHDVVAAVRTATRSGNAVVARSGPFPGTPARDGEIVVVTAGLDHVEVDAGGRQARVGVGATWRDVARAAAPFGLAPVPGDDPDSTVGTDVGLGVDGPWCRGLGSVRASVEAVDAVTADGRLATLPGCDAIAVPSERNRPVPTSVRLRLVDAAPVTVLRCRDLGAETSEAVERFLASLAMLPAAAAAALVLPARSSAPATWWLAARGPVRPPVGWPDLDVEVSRRPPGTVLRWPPVAGRGPVECSTLPVGAAAGLPGLLAAEHGGAVVLRHRGATPDGPWVDVRARGRAATRLAAALAPFAAADVA